MALGDHWEQVPHSTARNARQQIRLLNRKLDSRDRTLRAAPRLQIIQTIQIKYNVAAIPTVERNKYRPATTRERMPIAPRRCASKTFEDAQVEDTGTMFHTFIVPFSLHHD
jgi:hypothetical protein